MKNIWCGLVLAFGVTTIHAQAPAKVIVRVRDQSGAVITKAEVAVLRMIESEAPYVQVRPGTEKEIASDRTSLTGEAQFSLLPGIYQISIRSPGFMQFRGRLEVTSSSEQKVDVVLKIGFFGSGPVVVIPEELPLIASEPLSEMIPGVVLQELVLRSRIWKRGRAR